MEYREVVRQIVILAFEKARQETLQMLKTPLSKHISLKIEKDYKAYISEKTFVRYYDKYIGGKEKATGRPNRKILDFLCKYVGFDNLVDFYHKNKKRKEKRKTRGSMGLSNFIASLYEEALLISEIKKKKIEDISSHLLKRLAVIKIENMYRVRFYKKIEVGRYIFI